MGMCVVVRVLALWGQSVSDGDACGCQCAGAVGTVSDGDVCGCQGAGAVGTSIQQSSHYQPVIQPSSPATDVLSHTSTPAYQPPQSAAHLLTSSLPTMPPQQQFSTAAILDPASQSVSLPPPVNAASLPQPQCAVTNQSAALLDQLLSGE